MFEVKIYNPVILQMETVLALPGSCEDEAVIKAEEFLLSHGARIGSLVNDRDQKSRAIFGFKDQDSIAVKDGGFGFIPNSIYFMFKYIKEGLGLRVDSFIDLGCGSGNILISAKTLLEASELTGVEIDPALVRQAKENTGQFNAEIIQADLMEWTPAYNRYDMVYMYEPMREEGHRLKFLSHLKTWLRDGQYIYYQHIVGSLPEWFEPIDIPNHNRPCLFTFDKSKA
jgi:SAM-dependent methyltransferase